MAFLVKGTQDISMNPVETSIWRRATDSSKSLLVKVALLVSSIILIPLELVARFFRNIMVSVTRFFYSVSGAQILQKMQECAQGNQTIQFYDHTDPFTEWLGNFYLAPVHYKGLDYRCSEAAFQAQKFIGHPQIMQLFTTLDGEGTFKKAKACSAYQCQHWLVINVKEMTAILNAKVDQHPQIGQWLEATGASQLVEHNPVKGRDTFWSDDNDGTGQNMLGKIWMQIRQQRRSR